MIGEGREDLLEHVLAQNVNLPVARRYPYGSQVTEGIVDEGVAKPAQALEMVVSQMCVCAERRAPRTLDMTDLRGMWWWYV